MCVNDYQNTNLTLSQVSILKSFKTFQPSSLSFHRVTNNMALSSCFLNSGHINWTCYFAEGNYCDSTTSVSIFDQVVDAYNQTSAQREHDTNVTVVVRSMYITLRKIVSNIFKCNLHTGSAKYLFLENALKKTTEYFLKFLFLFESTILLRLIMENNFFQMAASTGHAVA